MIYRVGKSGYNFSVAKRKKPVVAYSDVEVQENLPYTNVLYPRHGAFIAFRETQDSTIYLCECSKGAVVNYIELRSMREYRFPDELRAYTLSASHFPDLLVQQLISENVPRKELLGRVPFQSNLCHKCNKAMPSRRFTDETYGTLFRQNYGWYIEQKWFEFGISRIWYDSLPDKYPADIRDILTELILLRRATEDAHKQWLGSDDPALTKDKNSISNSPEAINYRRLWFSQEPLKKQLADFVENSTRDDFGYKHIGEAWISETALYGIVKKLFPENIVERHYRPDWLKGLELDIFLPEYKLGIEYQGQQHFTPMGHWGGELKFKELQQRDVAKKKYCKENRVKLIEFKYDEPLDERNVRAKLKTYL